MMKSFGLLVGVSLGAAPEAVACPGAYASLACDQGGAKICTAGSNLWSCDLKANGDTVGGTLTAVYDISNTLCGDDYCAWGDDASGTGFCCTTSASAVDGANFIGGSHDDTLTFNYPTLGLSFDAASGDTQSMAAYAGAGDDVVNGSDSSNTSYSETLNGGTGEDVIAGNGGSDTINGSDDGDWLSGGDGDDVIDGGSGDDAISGGEDNDILYGQSGKDMINGNGGDDELYGEGGQDTLCGGDELTDGPDTLDGGSEDDKLYGAKSDDKLYAGSHTYGDDCDSVSADPNGECEATGLAADCPLPW